MRLCAIDVGSNTVRLLVADVIGAGTWRVADQDQTITRLGENLASAGALGEAPMARTLAVISGYVERGARLGASDIRIVATSAVREAPCERCRGEGVGVRGRLDEREDGVGRRVDGELAPAICATRVALLVGTAGADTPLAVLDLGLVRDGRDRVRGHVLTRFAVERL